MGTSSMRRKSIGDTQKLGPLLPNTFDPDEQFDAIGSTYVDDEDAVVYGLDDEMDEDENRANLFSTLRYVIAGVMAAALIIGGLMVVKPFGPRQQENTRKESAASREHTDDAQDDSAEKSTQADAQDDSAEKSTQESDTATDEQTETEGEQAASKEQSQPEQDSSNPQKAYEPFSVDDLGEVVTTADLDRLVRFISFDGIDLSIPNADMYTRISGARVEVVHILHDIEHADPQIMAGNASRRAAALATMLANRKIQGPGDQKPTLFNDVLWRITNVRDETFIALTFYSGFAPTSGEPLWVLMQSPYYCMSSSLYEALNHAAPQYGGGTPKALDGSTITAEASLDTGNIG